MLLILILFKLIVADKCGLDPYSICVISDKEKDTLTVIASGVESLYWLEDGHTEGETLLGLTPCDAPHSPHFKRGHECGEGAVCSPSSLNYTCSCPPTATLTPTRACTPSNAYYVIHFQILVILLITLATIAIYIHRRNKIIGMFSIYLVMNVGCIISNLALVFKLVDFSCVPVVWLKEVGFVVMNGPIVLKLYRSFVEFRTRKAHRWILREKDILKYLVVMVTLVVYFLLSWTLDNWGRGAGCTSPWTYVIEGGELVFLAVGLNLSWHLKNSTTLPPYFERWWLTGGVLVQFLGKLLVLVLLQFIQLTIWVQFAATHLLTLSWLVVMGPKFFYLLHNPAPSRGGGGEAKQTIKKQMLELNNELDFSEINIAEMDPNDIRYELKRVYTQLEVLRNKTMRSDNPHISKRRGGRKPTHRRFSLQKRGSRDKQAKQLPSGRQRSVRYNLDNERELEDSICSLEGVSTYSEGQR